MIESPSAGPTQMGRYLLTSLALENDYSLLALWVHRYVVDGHFEHDEILPFFNVYAHVRPVGKAILRRHDVLSVAEG